MATIHIVNEDRASIYTPLRDTERESGKVDTWAARHATSLTLIGWWQSQGLDWAAVGRC